MTSFDGAIKPGEIDTGAVLDGIRRWVEIETPSREVGGIGRLLSAAANDIAGLPIDIERVSGCEGFGDHLVLRYDPAGQGGPSALVMGHIDTVWDVGSLAERPVRIDGDRVYGPGIYDMKAGTYLGYNAMRMLAERDVVPPRPVTLLINSDEEVGSPTSRDLIERLARDAAFVLVPEPAVGPDIAAVTARKGWGRFVMTATGRPAHAGGNHAEGRSAIREIAHQILALEAMTDYDAGSTINVGVVRGGTRLNVVPAEAAIEIDFRVTSLAEADRLEAEILARAAVDPDVKLEISGGVNRPAFAPNDKIARLYNAARDLANDLGFALPETARGGASDGNFTAAMGMPTLDGLGCGGHGAHAFDEHILFSTIAPRAALMYGMLASAEFQRRALAHD